jgi:hypothetical protein
MVNNSHATKDLYLLYKSLMQPIGLITSPHFCAFLKPGSRFLMHILWFYVQDELKWEVIFQFLDKGGIVDHHCLNFLFKTNIFLYQNVLVFFIKYFAFHILWSWSCIRNLDPGLRKAQKCGEVIKPIGCIKDLYSKYKSLVAWTFVWLKTNILSMKI